VFINIDQYRK